MRKNVSFSVWLNRGGGGNDPGNSGVMSLQWIINHSGYKHEQG